MTKTTVNVTETVKTIEEIRQILSDIIVEIDLAHRARNRAVDKESAMKAEAELRRLRNNYKAQTNNIRYYQDLLMLVGYQ